jgi:hypothetical protein
MIDIKNLKGKLIILMTKIVLYLKNIILMTDIKNLEGKLIILMSKIILY